MKLYQLLTPDRIALDISAVSREAVIVQLVELLAASGVITAPNKVINAVLEREKQVGTGIGYGVAIPHSDPGPFSNPLLVFGRLSEGINFNAPDGGSAQLIFLLLTPERTPALHVRLLARICRLTRSTVLREELMKVTEPAQIIHALATAESDFPELNP